MSEDFPEEIIKILEAIGDRERLNLLAMMYRKGKVEVKEVEGDMTSLTKAGLVDHYAIVRHSKVDVNVDILEEYYEITELGRHVYRMIPLLFFSLDKILEIVFNLEVKESE